MALKVELKPNERVIIGTVVIRNGDSRARLFIEGQAPILREKDILTPASATTPARRIYLAVQLMYIDQDIDRHRDVYLDLVRDFVRAAPSSFPLVEEMNNRILNGEIYKALKAARAVIDYETELLSHVQGR